jgi:rSAM/selenodomain-associated transferase 2
VIPVIPVVQASVIEIVFISIIIPTLNEKTTIRDAALSLAGLSGEFEVIVVDGGSDDETAEIAAACGLPLIKAPRGRGLQMNAGAVKAKGDVLLFLHADTRLPANALAMIQKSLVDENVGGGNFRLAFDGGTISAQLLTILYPFLRLGGMCYGDSGFFVRRKIFDELEGFRDYPIFEDCDLYCRLKKQSKFKRLPAEATTSSRRFEGRFLRTFSLWLMLQILYWLGVDPKRLGRLYKAVR